MRFLFVNDVPDICQLVDELFRLSFDCEFDCAEGSVSAIRQLIDTRYDLVLLDCVHPEGDYSTLPAEVATRFRAFPREVLTASGVQRYSEGERLFRFLRSPEAARLGWKTDAQSVPVIFYTAGPQLLDEDALVSMSPVAILSASTSLENLLDETKRMLA